MQELLGHERVDSTERHTHVSQKELDCICSSVDHLPLEVDDTPTKRQS